MKRHWKGKLVKPDKHARLQALLIKAIGKTQDLRESENKSESDDVTVEESGWGNGRRIVKLQHLAEQLKTCRICAKPLQLHNTEQEQQIGYASILYITCETYRILNIL